MGAMTRLDAVNQMLLYAGEMIVSDLEGDSGIDTSIAVFLLDSKAQDYQQRGLAENQMVVRVSPAADGRIKTRTDALDVTMMNPPSAVNPVVEVSPVVLLFEVVISTTSPTIPTSLTWMVSTISSTSLRWNGMTWLPPSRRPSLCRPPVSTR